MFCNLFGWRKASKCKKLIKQALRRLEMLKNKRYSIVRRLREDLFELISNGYQQIAFNRVEQLIRDERLMEAYDLIESFCKFILMKLSHIRKHKTCPDDIMEAVSSLIFASARCGNFPELKQVRKLFEQRYGPSLVTTAVELCSGNLVNPKIKEKLVMKPVLDHEKQRLISEISRDCFYPAVLALEYCPDWHQKQEVENEDQTNGEEKGEPKFKDSNAEELETVAMSVDSSPDSSCDIVNPRCQLYPNEREDVHRNSVLAATTFEDGLYIENDVSSPEFNPSFDETVIYLDDVVELPNPSTLDGELWDQRFFKFKSSVTSMREKVQDCSDQSLLEYHEGSKKKPDSERCSRTRPKRENNSSSDTKKNWLSCHNLSSELPCYVYSEFRVYDYEVTVSKKTKTDSYFIRSLADNHLDNDLSSKDNHHHTDDISWNEDSEQEVESDTITFSRTKKIRSCEIGTVVYDVFVYSHCQPDENKENDAKPEEFSTKDNHKSCLGFSEMQNNFTKCMKVADKYPSHVHPKLPDCDEIAAKFMALKREYMQGKQNQ